jgi:putative transposase
MEKRNRYTAEFKAKVVLEVLREEQTVNEIASKYELSPVMISRWKAEFLDRASTVFEKKVNEVDKVRKEYEAKQERLEKLVGQLTVEVDWLKKNLALTAGPSGSSARSSTNASTSTNSLTLVRCTKESFATTNFTTRNARTSRSAKHRPSSSTPTMASRSHPNHRKEDITYFSKNRVLTLWSITASRANDSDIALLFAYGFGRSTSPW